MARRLLRALLIVLALILWASRTIRVGTRFAQREREAQAAANVPGNADPND